jgi:Tfp pilus assembly protein PilO
MKLPKNYFENLSSAKYRDYLKLLPNMQPETSNLFVLLALTFGALSFFGIFAINPTLTTIASLKKQLADDKATYEQLKTKVSALSSLENQYSQLGSNLTNIYNAIPQQANAPLSSGQIAALAQKNHLNLTIYRVGEVQLQSNKKNAKTQSFIFTLQAQGGYNDMINFTSDLANLNRIITIESMEIGRDNQTNSLELTLRCRQYFKQQ